MSLSISIAMATCNGEQYLSAQLQSFVEQKRLPDELVICDDGSRDATVAMVERFCRTAPFATRVLVNEENLGYVKNFERALAHCGGDLVFLSDQDDCWFSDKLAVMAQRFEQDARLFVLQADMVLADEHLTPSRYTQLGNILALGQSADRFVTGCGTALRRRWLDLALPVPVGLALGHDDWFHRLAIPLGARAVIDRPLQYYRRHGYNSSRWLASSPAGVSLLRGAREHGLRDASRGWRAERERIRAARSRIADSHRLLCELGLAERQAPALARLSRREDAYDGRLQTLSGNRVARLPRLLRFWAGGHYDEFAGWKSALKDLVR
jgi:glycosyltransferase involved in cell wall biosynthesis